MTFHRKLGNVVFILGGLAPKMGELAFIVTNLFLVWALHTALEGGAGEGEGSEELSSLLRGSLPSLACHLVPRPFQTTAPLGLPFCVSAKSHPFFLVLEQRSHDCQLEAPAWSLFPLSPISRLYM